LFERCNCFLILIISLRLTRDYYQGRQMLETEDDQTLKLVINRYLGKIFPLVFYLTGNNSDKSYEITTSSYVETFMTIRSLNDEHAFLIRLVKEAIFQCQNAKMIPSTKEPPFKDVLPLRIKMLQILSKALQELPFNEKALLLLRDQLHLSYKNIASVLSVSQSDARSHINRARIEIRKKVEGALL